MISEYAKQDIEKLRCKSLLYKRINIVVYAVIFLVLFILWIKLKVMGEDGVDYVQFLIFLTFAIAISIHVAGEKYVQVMRDFKSAYKIQFVVEILYEQFGNVDYIGIHGFSERVIQDFQLVHLANHMYSEDYLRAVYNGVIFEQSDVVIIEKERKEFPSVFFKGRMLKLSHSKEPVEDIRIFTRNFEHRVINNTIQVRGMEEALSVGADISEQTWTEDAEFNNMFDVYSANEQEVGELLTPTFRAVLGKLASRYGCIALRLTGNEAYVAIGARIDTFDCSLDEPIQYEMEEQRIIADADEIKLLIDALNGAA
ncbi:MAG: DUF3137 domain-containing protein [Lachnospiraceae bacterium]|nr:DUF3137 domain-containing protein [Lachnospiraceae bacterium]